MVELYIKAIDGCPAGYMKYNLVSKVNSYLAD
jgi:hypothetical protein